MFTTNIDTTDNTVFGDKTKIAQLEQEILSLKQQLANPCAHSSEHVRQFITMFVVFIFVFTSTQN